MMGFMEVSKSGILLLYYHDKKKFKTRWFAIRGQVLHFYRDENDTSKIKGSFDLAGTRVYTIPTTDDPKLKEKEELIFELINAQQKLVLVASNVADKKSWCDAFTRAKSAPRKELDILW